MTGILNGKVALVTGGASGIGRATALAMAREGARLAIADRTEESAAATVGLINAAGGQAIAIGGDVTREDDVAGMVARTVSAFGQINCAFNNAGISGRAVGPAGQRLHELSQTSFDAMLAVNLTGVFLVTRAVIPHVRARGGGSLIAVTTTGVTMPGANAYWVSKAGVERLYLGLAADLKPDNIAVNCLSPSRVVLTEGWLAGGGGQQGFGVLEHGAEVAHQTIGGRRG